MPTITIDSTTYLIARQYASNGKTAQELVAATISQHMDNSKGLDGPKPQNV